MHILLPILFCFSSIAILNFFFFTMAFVDLIPPNHKQRSSAFTQFRTFHAPEILPPALAPSQAPASLTPGAPTLYSSFPPSFCPHCHYQFNASYGMNGLCMNCNLPLSRLPPPSLGHSLIPPIQHSGPPIHPHPGPVSPQNHTYKDIVAIPPPGASSHPFQRLPAGLIGRSAQDPSETNVDRFMMTSIIEAVNDVLEEPHDIELGMHVNTTNIEPYVLNVTQGSDGFMAALPISDNCLSPHNDEGVPGKLTSMVQVPTLKNNPCQCGNDHMAFCLECQEFLCSNCLTSHEKSSSSKDHQILRSPSSSLPSSQRTTPPGSVTSRPISSPSKEPLPTFEEDELELDSCSEHPDEKLAYFCVTCVGLACNMCTNVKHAHHNCLGLIEAYKHFKPSIKDLLGKTQVELDLLEYSLAETKKMSNRVSEKQQEAVANVKKIFQTHRDALAMQEQKVITQINDIANLRITSLLKEEKSIFNAMESIQSHSKAGEKALQEGNKSQMLSVHFHLNNSLQNCRIYTNSRSTSEDDSFILKSNSLASQSTLKNLCMLTTAPYPPLCTAMGEGLYHPRVNRLCTVILAAKDRAGESCLEGGERLFVQLKCTSGGDALPIDFRDNSDGTYSINFRPRVKGEHQLVIAIRGQHVQGSPFTLYVDGGREYGHFGVVTQVFGSEGSQNGQFCRPWGICCDQHGNIIVGDRSNHRIQVFDSSGVFKHKFGTEGVRPGQFNRPAGIAVTREGHVVVADKDNHRIQVLKIDGSFLFMFGSKGGNDGQMIYPYDVAVNQLDGRIAVTDTGNHRLLIFSHDGILLGKFGYKGYLCGHFDSPRGIAFNDEGHIIVSDFNVHHILVIHPDGTTARILGSQGSGNGQFMRPQGIAVDHMGNFIVADTRNNRIVIMHPSGHFVAKFGAAGSAPGQFDRPTSIAVLPDGRVAIVDFGNSRIQIF